MGTFLLPKTREEIHDGKYRHQAYVLNGDGAQVAECEHWHLKAEAAQRCAERLCLSA